ncbi:hypothetical protein ALC152_19390 [Arcobacter sp. 15-2]|uniref:AAA family ATPase n=1 Tax=Arcobacter sp. 15-2 TaxID=3374109 RepID=UPI00399CCE76
MELVYLWVEKYKNIKKQGFNFSPRFKCEYDEDTKELTIDDKRKDYVSIFPDNINITAIVGENGSGKSSIVEQILNKIELSILLYEKDGIYYISTNLKDINCNKDYQKIENNFEYFSYLNSDILKTANIRNFSDFFNSATHISNIYIKKFAEGSNSEILKLEKLKQEVYKSIFKTFTEKIELKFKFIPIKITIFKNKKNIDNLTKVEIEYLNRLENNQTLTIKEFMVNYFENVEDLFFNLLKNECINIDLQDEEERNLFDLSHGERRQFTDTVFVYEELMKKNDDCIILLDEPDLGIHSKWQKQYINELINIFSTLNKKLHFIITSHSPFILSDLPAKNVIFLKDGKQEYPFKEKQTFGANIHTLLSDGFFMSDGLMGEFAKGKIEEIKKFYDENKDLKKEDVNFNTQKIDYESKKERFNHIQSIIGEPFLKTVIKNYLDELELIFLDKDTIDLELSKIEERKSYLEKLKNAKN